MSSGRVVASQTPVARPATIVPEGWLGRAYDQFLIWLERSRQRQHLAMLSDHMLKDIGLTRVDVEAEVSKPFWEA
jgi:uncharacterized protein YjiS (DUF1127 family)